MEDTGSGAGSQRQSDLRTRACWERIGERLETETGAMGLIYAHSAQLHGCDPGLGLTPYMAIMTV